MGVPSASVISGLSIDLYPLEKVHLTSKAVLGSWNVIVWGCRGGHNGILVGRKQNLATLCLL